MESHKTGLQFEMTAGKIKERKRLLSKEKGRKWKEKMFGWF
jgi:hypothetical protein